jgi:LSD1 subclass zinc finger protein
MPEDMDIYMKKIRQRAEETDNVMGKIKQDKMAELDKLRIDNEMEEVRARLEENRAKIRESQQTGQALAPQQVTNFAELLFAGRPPEEIKQIISTLTQEEIQKLAYMASAMNNNKLSEFREYMRQPSTSMKEVVDAIKIGTEIAKPQQQQQGSISDIAKSMAEMFKTGVEIGRGQNQPQQPQQNSLEMMKQYNDMFLKPVLDQLNSKDREMMTLRMNQIESKITQQVSPQEYIKQVKESANTLGLTGGGKTEIDLKLSEMAQTERLENRKIDWEQQKHQEDKEGEKELYALFGKAIDGPIADLTKSVGGAAAKRIEGGGRNPNTQNRNNPQLTQIPCPQCNKPFSIITGAQQVVCPSCNAILGLQQSPPPQQAPSPPAQTQEQQLSEATQQTEQSNQQPEQQQAEAPEPVQSEQPKQ